MATWDTTATVTAVSGTRPIPKSAIGLTFTLNSRGEKKKAAEYRSGGRKIRKTRSGGSSIPGTPGMRPKARPPEDEEGRVRHPEDTGELHEPRHSHEQPEYYEL
jgi:hypothetical protein